MKRLLSFDLSGSKTKDAPRIAQRLETKFDGVAVSDNLAAALLIARHRKRVTKNEKLKTKNQNYPKPTFEESTKTKYSEFASPAPIENGTEFSERAFGARKKAEAKRSSKEEYRIQNTEFREDTEPRAVARGDKEYRIQDSEYREERESRSGTENVMTGAQAPSPAVSEAKETTKNEKLKTKSSTKQSKPQTRNLNSTSTWNLELETWNLDSLPLNAISDKLEFLELMDSWAVHDLQTFCQLPEDEMVERFGSEILGLRRLASGQSFRAPNWNVKEDKFYWEKELQGVIETLEPLNFIISKGVMQIFQNLDYVGLSTQSAKIIVRGRKKKKTYRVRIVFPTKNKKIWIRQIMTKIELNTPKFNIDHVALEFRSTKPRSNSKQSVFRFGDAAGESEHDRFKTKEGRWG